MVIEINKSQILEIVLKQKMKGSGRLHVYSYPWADLYLDGAYVGTTPTPTPVSLVEGKHKIMLKREGYQSYSETVDVKNDEVTRVQVQLDRITAE